MKEIVISLDEDNKIYNIAVRDENNNVEHNFDEEPYCEKQEYYKMTLRDFVKEYLEYFEENKEENYSTKKRRVI